jgi:hypothetical protein
MAKKKDVTDIVRTIVGELTGLTSEERQRVVQASLMLLGEASPGAPKVGGREQDQDVADKGISTRAYSWMRQNDLSLERLSHVFHIGAEGVEIIAPEIPGNSNRDKVRNAYVLLGVARFLDSGEARFDDKAARALCARYGFYDQTNHTKYMKGGNEFTGSKSAGWTVTTPGLKHGAVLIKLLTGSPDD